MATQALSPRLFGGFGPLRGGVDSGQASSLIAPDQLSAAVNATMRGSYLKTRPPWKSHPLTFDNATTESRWFGKFQGECPYDGELGQSGWVVSRGGKLFFINSDTFVISEITPRLFIVTLHDFTVPAANATVDVDVNSETPIATGDTVYVDSGSYLVVNRATDQLTLKYISGAASAVALAGNAVLNSSQTTIFEYQTNPDYYELIYIFQAENYIIVLATQQKTIIFDGSSARQAGWNEIPSGVLGAYGWGRIWICRADRRTFVAGDLVFGPSGTAALGFRDAILKFTENDFLNEGGAFGVPYNAGPITHMEFLTTIDNSLGIGVLLVGTSNMVFSVNAPVDRTTWKNLQYPIQTISLLDYGPEGPRFGASIDGDLWYRSSDGVRSFRTAQVHFRQPGNTPLSREIAPILDYDSPNLLFFGSAVKFDNRLLLTVSPFRSKTGIQHRGLACINYDLVSNLRTTLPPAWEGVWTGLNILQISKCRIKNQERCFAFVRGDDLELWEILTKGYYDELNTETDGQVTITRNPIAGVAETRSDNHGDSTQLKSLRMGELYVDEIFDTVNLTIKWRPDQYPTWSTWATIQLCASVSQCTLKGPVGATCSMWKVNSKQYAARIGIPQPSENCNSIAGIPLKQGFEFQYRLEWSGSCRIRMFKIHADVVSQPMEGSCPAVVQCKEFPDCGTDWFTYDSHVGGVPPDSTPVIPPSIPPPPAPAPPSEPPAGPITALLNGLLWLMPCPPNGHCTDPADQVETVTGTAGTTWNITVRIRGLVELKPYLAPGVVVDGTGGRCILNGFYGPGDLRNTYSLRISDPPAVYQLNRHNPPSPPTPEEGFQATVVDYQFTFQVKVGATVTLRAESIDGLEFPNSGNLRVPLLTTDPPILVTQPFPGQFLQMSVVSVVPA